MPLPSFYSFIWLQVQFSESKTASMSAEVQKVLITTFSLVLYSVNLKYLKKEILRVTLALLYIVFIHWSRYWYGLVSWWYPSDILVIIYGNFLIYELFNLYQCRALYRRIKQTEKTKQELARSLKTATSKVSQLEVSNSLSKAVL